MFSLIRLLFSSFLGLILMVVLVFLAFIGRFAAPADNSIFGDYPVYDDYPEYEENLPDYETLLELPRDEEAYQKSLKDVNALREKCFYGTNQYLSGDVTAVVIYVNDFESSLTDAEMDEFTEKDVEPALEFLEREAQKYGVELDFETEVMRNAYYDDEVIIDLDAYGLVTVDVLDSAAESYDFNSEFEFHDWWAEKNGTEVVFITVFNKAGISYGLNPKPGTDLQAVEHTVTFSIDLDNQTEYKSGTCATIIANSILHLYGGESLNKPEDRRFISQWLYPNDIMRQQPFDISGSDIGEATAYYIGWTDEIPEVVYSEGWTDYNRVWGEGAVGSENPDETK